ncbi:MAG: HDOD domain-containing protein [Pseudomonadota bacterium]
MASPAQTWLSSHNNAIPALDLHHQQAIEFLGSKSRTLGDLAVVIARDPGMCLALYQKVNGQLEKAGKCSVDTARTAIGLLGDEAISRLIKSQKCLSKVISNQDNIRAYHQLLSRCYHAQIQLDRFISIQQIRAIDEVREATLLHHLGEIFICLNDHKRYQLYLDEIQNRKNRIESARAAFGFTPEELGQLLAKAWKLPELVLDSLIPNEHAGLKARLIQLASRVASQGDISWHGEPMTQIVRQCAEYLNKPVNGFDQHIQQAAIDAARSCPIDDVFPAAARIILQPDRPKPQKSAAPIAKPAAPIKPKAKSDVMKTDLASWFKRLLASPSCDQGRILDLVLNHLHSELQLKPVVFLGYTQEKKHLIARRGKGISKQSPITKLKFDSANGLVKLLMQKSQAFWVDSEKREKYAKVIPPELTAAFPSQNLFMMSVFCGEKPLGLLIATPAINASQSERACYLKFRNAIQLTGKALNYLEKRSHRPAA